ncbi:1,4-beta-N-acetylmuramidase [Streptococcus pneumoniae]|nr:1,4-beta-N-acetylmuramidase [Streptococcus pneumoniae]
MVVTRRMNGMELLPENQVDIWPKTSGSMTVINKSWFYLKSDGGYAHQEWQLIGNKWYYFKKWGYMAKKPMARKLFLEWSRSYDAKMNGSMIQPISAYFYLKSDGTYANQEWQKSGRQMVLFQEVGLYGSE